MCFSATASFGASTALSGIGVAAVTKATDGPQKLLASIPFVFAAQQFVEGMLWLSLSQPAVTPWVNIATYVFLFFAQVVWPVLVPLTVLMIEKETINRRVLTVTFVIGLIISAFLFCCLIFYRVNAQIDCQHILYDTQYPKIVQYAGIFYFIPTVFPPIISSIKRLRLLGVLILAAYIVSEIFYRTYLISVWCFFAAIVSSVALSVIMKLNKDAKDTHNALGHHVAG